MQAHGTVRLQGVLDQTTGFVQLEFVAQFKLTASLLGWSFYTAPPLLVTTSLTTKGAQVLNSSPLHKFMSSDLGVGRTCNALLAPIFTF